MSGKEILKEVGWEDIDESSIIEESSFICWNTKMTENMMISFYPRKQNHCHFKRVTEVFCENYLSRELLKWKRFPIHINTYWMLDIIVFCFWQASSFLHIQFLSSYFFKEYLVKQELALIDDVHATLEVKMNFCYNSLFLCVPGLFSWSLWLQNQQKHLLFGVWSHFLG